MSLYQVTGSLRFRDHEPGDVFEANLEPLAEYRALRRRNIRVLEVSQPTLQPGSYTLPRGWLKPQREV